MDIPTFVKNEQGLYHVQGCVKPEEIVSTAATILLDDLTSREALTAPTDVAQFLQLALAQEKNEVFSAIFLSSTGLVSWVSSPIDAACGLNARQLAHISCTSARTRAAAPSSSPPSPKP